MRINNPLLVVGCASILITAASVVASSVSEAEEPKSANDAEIVKDPLTGMIVAEHWEIVRNNCIACHSTRQFLRQRGTRRSWTGIIRWMQKEQGLWQFDPGTEDKILSYLAKNYAPDESSRRPLIPADLMPPNPYVSGLKAEFEKKRAADEIPTRPK